MNNSANDNWQWCDTCNYFTPHNDDTCFKCGKHTRNFTTRWRDMQVTTVVDKTTLQRVAEYVIYYN